MFRFAHVSHEGVQSDESPLIELVRGNQILKTDVVDLKG